MHTAETPSEWLCRWSHLIAPGSTALDVACGAGRHLRWLRGLGHRVVGVDRCAQAIAACAGLGEMLCADVESGPWPLAGRQFGAVVVTNYLWRPLLPRIVDSVAPGGLLICETFAQGQETVGRPTRPQFLLRPGELLGACAGLRVLGYEDGFLEQPARFVQRIAALRELPQSDAPARHHLPPRGSAG
ncbi:class I SAM-dependent methyltransferase [Verminephrobacter aporrectodeae subsp. tuberculatae]|uniref:class I SAM-dependent methyltransferase n=1 Tax=Verminephrobacter aporrectodeae TaxID=1110389 RepID=UPI0022435925|nr:class I SAM-dependent methyltransferase [Verminephrobacter aporrectodeae]MCW8163840.1 class I SAM-dependent methyltransferase [Verminephrobacter aporrectodeae subsp. tuberculatae]MCW8168075.1 class I SAM-dependent methyltransferase [Verminephrobacter aporrectodeae subsp. tuberculatae]